MRGILSATALSSLRLQFQRSRCAGADSVGREIWMNLRNGAAAEIRILFEQQFQASPSSHAQRPSRWMAEGGIAEQAGFALLALDVSPGVPSSIVSTRSSGRLLRLHEIRSSGADDGRLSSDRRRRARIRALRAYQRRRRIDRAPNRERPATSNPCCAAGPGLAEAMLVLPDWLARTTADSAPNEPP